MLGKKKKNKKEKQTFFGDQWEEIELIGEGSYGKVYKAKKEEFGIVTYSAIKQISIPQSKAEVQTLKTEGMTSSDITNYYEKSVQKWVEEIKFMSIFKDSENVVKIEDYEILKKEDGIGWIINIRMELLQNLDSYILERNITDKEILKMAIDVTTALEDCEENNVIHRDIKPDNIFINKKGVYKVGDFGIAKKIEKTVSNMSKKGTENYMAPELYKNEKGNRTVDIYSLGIMLYRYFNYNRLPFLPDYPNEITIDSREDALYKRISGEKMKAPQNATREIAEIILKACSYYPKDRYTTASELKKDLTAAYEKIGKSTILFDFDAKKMNKIFIENTKSDTHNSTLSILTGKQIEDNVEEKPNKEEETEKVAAAVIAGEDVHNKTMGMFTETDIKTNEKAEEINMPKEEPKVEEKIPEQEEKELPKEDLKQIEEIKETPNEEIKNEKAIAKEELQKAKEEEKIRLNEEKAKAKAEKEEGKKAKAEAKLKENEEKKNEKLKQEEEKKNAKIKAEEEKKAKQAQKAEEKAEKKLKAKTEKEAKKTQNKENKIKSPMLIKLKSHKKKIIIGAIALLFLLIVILLLIFKPWKTEVVEELISVPLVVGMNSTEAIEELGNLGLEIEYEYTETENDEEVGLVLEQSIAENEEVTAGTVIKLTIAVSKSKVTVTNVVRKGA